MKLLRFVILLCAAILGSTAMAQSQDELQQLMRNRGEYYFTLSVDDPTQIQTLGEICSVDGTDGRTVVAYANQQEYDKLIALGFQPELQTPPSLRQEAKMWEGGDRATYEWNSYLSYGDYVAMMESFPTSVTNGANCTLVDLGTLSTSNHRRILGVRLNNGQPNGKPKFLYTSTMHGDEVTGMILMLRLIDEFCTSNETRIQNILANVDLFIFPCTNPDGTYYGGNSTVNGARRYNGNGTDLNRHFPDFDDGPHPDGASYYQDEAQWMMDLAQQYLFTMGANYHGGAEIVNYPWDTYQPLHPDDAWWQYVSREYAQLCQAVNSSYMKTANSSGDTPSGITNGYAWYTITGSRQDYMNYYGQCREVTVECSKSKTPSASTLPNYWNYNHNAMLTYIEQCLNGVHGFVYDAETGLPIQGVTVTVQGHDAYGSEVSTHTIGDFHRPIKGGTYTFTFSKEGYYPETVQVTVADGGRVELNNIVLTPITWSITATANPVEGGSVEGAGNYVNGETCTLTATSADDYQFAHWTENGEVVSTENPYSFTVTSDRALVAVFGSTIPVSINVSASPTRGGLVSGGGEFLYGETCTVTATPNDGYNFINWTENGTIVSENQEYSFMVTNGSNLVAHFLFAGAVPSTSCYHPVNSVSASEYIIMGYLNDSTLAVPTHNNSSTVTTSTISVSLTDYGFSVEEGTSIPEVTLTAYGNNGQYYIKYNNRYLAKSNNGNGLTWGSNTSSNGRWYINANEIYVAVSSGSWYNQTTTNYYLHYNNGTFQLSTTQQNNITFYAEGDCPLLPQYAITATANPTIGGTIDGADLYYQGETCTLTATANEGYAFVRWTEGGETVSSEATITFEVDDVRNLVANFERIQFFSLEAGLNWWTPTVAMELSDLETLLEGHAILINSQDEGFARYDGEGWSGTLTEIEPGQMYRILTTAATEFTLSGEAVTSTITILPGYNWFGYIGSQPKTISAAFSEFTPTEDDTITAKDGTTATYTNGSWDENFILTPGHGYVYYSNAPQGRSLNLR